MIRIISLPLSCICWRGLIIENNTMWYLMHCVVSNLIHGIKRAGVNVVLCSDAELLCGSLPRCLRVHGWDSGWKLQLQRRTEESEFQSDGLSMTRSFLLLGQRFGVANIPLFLWQNVSLTYAFVVSETWKGLRQHVEGETLPWQTGV